MIHDLLVAAMSLALIVYVGGRHPTRAQCPSDWWINGVRTDGTFQCFPRPPGGETEAPQPAGEIRGQIYCTGGMRPIVVNYHTVGCQRGPVS